MKRSLAVIVCGVLVILWMVAARPAAGRVAWSQSSPADDPLVQGDVSSAAWSAQCQPVPGGGEESAIDPIKNWGATAPHTHEFFAQQTILSTSSPGALITPTAAPTGCDGPTDTVGSDCTYVDTNLATPTNAVCDKSGYWVPELIYDTDPTNTVTTAPASPLQPAFMNIYWRNEYSNPSLDTTFPEDLSMIAGNATTTAPQNTWIVNWQCVAPASHGKWQSPGRYSSTIPPYCDLPANDACPPDHAYPNCLPVYLRMVITFPECVKLAALNTTQGMITPTATWYGVTGSPTPPAPQWGVPGSYINCPASFSAWLQIPNIQIDPHWRLNGGVNQQHNYAPKSLNTTDTGQVDGQGDIFDCTDSAPCLHFDLSNLLLSSDLMMDQMGMDVTAGTTSHADYENGYTQASIDALIAECFHNGLGGKNCGAI